MNGNPFAFKSAIDVLCKTKTVPRNIGRGRLARKSIVKMVRRLSGHPLAMSAQMSTAEVINLARQSRNLEKPMQGVVHEKTDTGV